MSASSDHFGRALSGLRASADRLNSATDNINKFLATAQAQIIGSNIGIEAWLDSHPLAEDEWRGGSGRWATSHGTRTLLGFCKIDGRWALSIREQKFERGNFEGDEECPYFEPAYASEAEPLLKASRPLRLAALAALPQLVELLSTTADQAYDRLAEHDDSLPSRLGDA
jgi:hypothetical protein